MFTKPCLYQSFRENATSQKVNKRVLVPSPYFERTNNEKTSISEASSQHILYPSSFARSLRNNACKSPIEPTVINLNYELPELGKDPNSRFPTKKRMKKQQWGSSGCNKKSGFLWKEHRTRRLPCANRTWHTRPLFTEGSMQRFAAIDERKRLLSRKSNKKCKQERNERERKSYSMMKRNNCTICASQNPPMFSHNYYKLVRFCACKILKLNFEKLM